MTRDAWVVVLVGLALIAAAIGLWLNAAPMPGGSAAAVRCPKCGQPLHR